MLRIYPVIVETIGKLGPVMVAIEKRDGDLARQMRRAACSVVLNTREGIHARGRNGALRYNTAMGSMRETRACIDVAVALQYVDDIDAALRDAIDRVVATLYRLSV